MYAAGWDPRYAFGLSGCRAVQAIVAHIQARQPLCARSTLRQCDGQKAAEKPTDNSGNRAVVFLVETSDSKAPDAAALGGGLNPLEKGATSAANGHVARNTRLALAAVDAAQPYVCFSAVATPQQQQQQEQQQEQQQQQPVASPEATAPTTAEGGNRTRRAAASAGAASTGKHTLTLRWYVDVCRWRRCVCVVSLRAPSPAPHPLRPSPAPHI